MQWPFDQALESGRGGHATWNAITINGKGDGVERRGNTAPNLLREILAQMVF
jgi:hypothetical protein